MTKQLTTQNATITTVAVEVKTLTITGKQVTLAVFRQLREEPLVSSDGTLNGTPWGYVNYHPDKCAGDDHWHIVWQRGTELLRSRVDHELPCRAWGCDEGDAFLSAHAREVFEHRGQYFNGRLPAFDGDNYLTATLKAEAPFSVTMDLAPMLAVAYFTWSQWRSTADRHAKAPDSLTTLSEPRERAKLAQAVERLSCAAPEPGEVAELYAAYKGRLAEEIGRRLQHQQVRAGLAQLPQLFIAV